jgi:hypothetical protein
MSSAAGRIGRARIALAACLLAMVAPVAAAEPDRPAAGYSELVTLFGEFSTWRAKALDPLGADFSPHVVAARRAELSAMQARLQTMEFVRWPRPQKIDWLLVRSRMDEADFVQRITRPWARDPGFYTAELQRIAFSPLPARGPALAKLRAELVRAPIVLAQARANLTDVAADHADLAIHLLDNSDGIEDGYPVRTKPPSGVIGWYEDLLGRALTQQPALVADIERSLAALRAYREWLIANRASMNGRAGVGRANLDWYLRNVLLMPYSSRDALALGQRELERFGSFHALERHRNRKLPELTPARSEAEYLRRLADTDARIRRFIVAEEFMTVPPVIPDDWRKLVVPPNYLEPYNVPFIRRAVPPNFWEQIQYRDPSPDHWHAVIPGHRFDLKVALANPNPIRAKVLDGARWQGWAVYLEESALQAGFFDNRPRVRELIYLFGLWRAARTIGDIRNQLNEMDAAQVAKYWQEVTPMMDADVARKYAHIRTLPGHGLEYTIGAVQMWALLAERKRQLGDQFVLRNFHDEFIAKGRIPIALIRWEMTGDDREAEPLFDRQPLN